MMRFITGVAASSALTYLFDPQSGRRRRSLLRDQAVRLQHRVQHDVQASARDAANRARGLASQAREKVPFADRLLAGQGTSAGSSGAARGGNEMAIAGAVLAALMLPFGRRILGRLLIGGLPQLAAIGAVMAARSIAQQEQAARAGARGTRPERAQGADDDAPEDAPPITMIDPNL